MINSLASMKDKEMTKKDMLKMAAGIVICIGADVTVTTLIGHHMPSLKGWKKYAVMLGTFVLGMKAGEEAENYFYQVFDETEQTLKQAKTEIDKVVEETAKEPAEEAVPANA